MWYRNHHVKMRVVVVVMSRTRRLVLIARLLRPHCGEVDQLAPRFVWLFVFGPLESCYLPCSVHFACLWVFDFFIWVSSFHKWVFGVWGCLTFVLFVKYNLVFFLPFFSSWAFDFLIWLGYIFKWVLVVFAGVCIWVTICDC